jgi:hypothetical protein
MLSVLSFDLGRATLGSGDPVSVVADGSTVYSTASTLYVAGHVWSDPAGEGGRDTTELYRFDTTGTGRPRFAAAGSVPGTLLNQYSMSEWDGNLRVATTTTPAPRLKQPAPEVQQDRPDSGESAVYVLRQRGGKLVEAGHVGGLGKGERIYAVRFAGGTGYVVTFRQTDPLYTLDLRNPARPALRGELKINGYSAYLHPAGDGRLLGIGQEATDQGRTQGTQVSLFDVTDPAAPSRLAQYHVRFGHSAAEFDPHAFLYWPASRLLVVPVITAPAWDARVAPGSGPAEKPTGSAPESGALVLRVADTGFTRLGLLSHPVSNGAYRAAIQRSLVIGDTLWTVSTTGVAAHDVTSLGQVVWIAFT